MLEETSKNYSDAQKREYIKSELIRVWKRVGHHPPGNLAAWMELNLTIAQFKCLVYMDMEGSTNQKSLAAALGVTPPNVTGIIDRLLEQGLVNRHENETNRRMQVIELTTKAKDLLFELKRGKEIQLTSLLDQLQIEDLAALLQGLNALYNLEIKTAAKTEDQRSSTDQS